MVNLVAYLPIEILECSFLRGLLRRIRGAPPDPVVVSGACLITFEVLFLEAPKGISNIAFKFEWPASYSAKDSNLVPTRYHNPCCFHSPFLLGEVALH